MAGKLAPLLLFGLLLLAIPSPHSGLAAGPPAVAACDGEKARQAIDHFWKVFQGNDYVRVDAVIRHLALAQGEDPATLTLATFSWRQATSGNTTSAAAPARRCFSRRSPYLALHYLKTVQELDPHRRTGDVFAHFAMTDVGQLQGNRALVEESLEAILGTTRGKDPAFNGFVQGWVFSAMSEKDCRYSEAIEGVLCALDTCAGFRVPRSLPRLGPVLDPPGAACPEGSGLLQYRPGPAQSRSNPHGPRRRPPRKRQPLRRPGWRTEVPGGRRVTRPGRTRTRSNAGWASLDALKCKFRAETGKLDVHGPAMFFQSACACTACHAK